MLEVIAFINAIKPFIPLAVAGISIAKDFVTWGLDTIGDQVNEGRAPTPAEWDELNLKIAALREKLHSDAF